MSLFDTPNGTTTALPASTGDELRAPWPEPPMARLVTVRRGSLFRLVDIECPHCGKLHHHGSIWEENGKTHRVSHCTTGLPTRAHPYGVPPPKSNYVGYYIPPIPATGWQVVLTTKTGIRHQPSAAYVDQDAAQSERDRLARLKVNRQATVELEVIDLQHRSVRDLLVAEKELDRRRRWAARHYPEATDEKLDQIARQTQRNLELDR